MKLRVFIAAVIACAGIARADSTTTRLGLTVPDIGSTGWGLKLNNNWSVIDSSVASQGTSNEFTAQQRFDTGVYFYGGTSWWDPTKTKSASAQIFTSNKAALVMSASDGLFLNGNYFVSPASINLYPITGQTYGSFAVVGSSADASTAYSGFMSTSPISQSTLWSLPKADGTIGQPIVTDGSSHLSFSGTLNVSSVTVSVANNNNVPITLNQPNFSGAYSVGIGLQQTGLQTLIRKDFFGQLDNTTQRYIYFNPVVLSYPSYGDQFWFNQDGRFVMGSADTKTENAYFAVKSSTNMAYQIATSTSSTAGLYDFYVSTSGVVGVNTLQLTSKTKATLQATSPTAVGQVFYCSDCSTAVTCISSGTAINQWYSSTSRSTGCQ